MKKEKNRQDLLAKRMFIEISEEMSDKDSQETIRSILSSIVEEAIDESKMYESRGIALDTSIGVILGMNNHEAVIDLRKRVYHKAYDCDYSPECTYRRSAQFCFTEAFRECPGYHKPTMPVSTKPLGKIFRSS